MAILSSIDVEEARDIHELAFPGDRWPGDHHTFWVAKVDGKLAGLCSAFNWDEKGVVYLSRAAVVQRFMGQGIHRQMIRHRLRWARRQGVPAAITYTTLHNYPSMVDLLRCRFRFDMPPPAARFVGDDVHYFRCDLR